MRPHVEIVLAEKSLQLQGRDLEGVLVMVE